MSPPRPHRLTPSHDLHTRDRLPKSARLHQAQDGKGDQLHLQDDRGHIVRESLALKHNPGVHAADRRRGHQGGSIHHREQVHLSVGFAEAMSPSQYPTRHSDHQLSRRQLPQHEDSRTTSKRRDQVHSPSSITHDSPGPHFCSLLAGARSHRKKILTHAKYGTASRQNFVRDSTRRATNCLLSVA